MNRVNSHDIKPMVFKPARKDAAFFKSQAVGDRVQSKAVVIVVIRTINSIRDAEDKVFNRDISESAQ